MAKLFTMYWPADVHLTLYAERFRPDNTVPSHRVFELPAWLLKFKARHCTDPVKNGRGDTRKYNLLLDVVRFSHKVGAVIDTIERALTGEPFVGPDVVIWLDADIVTHSLVSHDFLRGLVDGLPVQGSESLAPAISWLNRDKKYPECGFVMFHLRHPALPALIAAWKTYYTDDRFLQLDAWTDCHTLQAAVAEVNAPWSSLSGPFSGLGHPFINGPLGAVMDHLKGERKREGKSRRHDLRARRREPYWRNVR
jgi:hypothetical protein